MENRHSHRFDQSPSCFGSGAPIGQNPPSGTSNKKSITSICTFVKRIQVSLGVHLSWHSLTFVLVYSLSRQIRLYESPSFIWHRTLLRTFLLPCAQYVCTVFVTPINGTNCIHCSREVKDDFLRIYNLGSPCTAL